jgi:hypothetical protein
MQPSEERDWLDQLCEVESLENTRKYQITTKSNGIFQQLRDEISRIIDRYNASHPTGTSSPAVALYVASDLSSYNAQVERITGANHNREILEITFPIPDGVMRFEHGNRHGEIEIEIVSAQPFVAPLVEYRISGAGDELYTTQSLVEFLLKPLLFTEEIRAKADRCKVIRLEG